MDDFYEKMAENEADGSAVACTVLTVCMRGSTVYLEKRERKKKGMHFRFLWHRIFLKCLKRVSSAPETAGFWRKFREEGNQWLSAAADMLRRMYCGWQKL